MGWHAAAPVPGCGVRRAGVRLRRVLICRARCPVLFSPPVRPVLKVLDADGFAGRILPRAGFWGVDPCWGSCLGKVGVVYPLRCEFAGGRSWLVLQSCCVSERKIRRNEFPRQTVQVVVGDTASPCADQLGKSRFPDPASVGVAAA